LSASRRALTMGDRRMDSIGSPQLWIGFLGVVAAMLALDLGVFHRDAHKVTVREAAIWTAVWISLSGGFALLVWHWFGSQRALEFTAGYVLEKSLSLDNIFVFVIIFSTFRIPAGDQHRVLFWGVLGALAMRAAFILAGGAFLARFHWAVYVLGAVLAFTGLRLLLRREQAPHPEQSRVMRVFRRVVPVTSAFDGHHFITRIDGRRVATPLLTALVAVELSDIVFAIDSVPAIFGVTDDPFIVFTSNIFAILGLRSMYFLLAGVIDRFVYLTVGLSLVLVFVGAKMLLTGIVSIPIAASLGAIAAILGAAIGASIWRTRRDAARTPP
jgi:tellurite resistance protein TerC